MAAPVVHFEITGRDPAALRAFYGALFGWQFDLSGAVSPAVSEPDDYGFVAPGDGPAAAGGIGGGPGFTPRTLFYVGVEQVETALAEAERLGGRRVLGPERAPSGLVIGHLHDPEGNLVGVAGNA